MKLKLLSLLTIILILASMSCKKKDDDTNPTAPKTTLLQRAGTYIYPQGQSITVVVSNDGTITAALESKKFSTTSTDTTFNLSSSVTVVFKSLNEVVLKSSGSTDMSCFKN